MRNRRSKVSTVPQLVQRCGVVWALEGGVISLVASFSAAREEVREGRSAVTGGVRGASVMEQMDSSLAATDSGEAEVKSSAVRGAGEARGESATTALTEVKIDAVLRADSISEGTRRRAADRGAGNTSR